MVWQLDTYFDDRNKRASLWKEFQVQAAEGYRSFIESGQRLNGTFDFEDNCKNGAHHMRTLTYEATVVQITGK